MQKCGNANPRTLINEELFCMCVEHIQIDTATRSAWIEMNAKNVNWNDIDYPKREKAKQKQ